MATKKYLSLDKLQKYDAKIKALMDTKDAAKLKEAKDYADSLASNYEVAGAAGTVKTELTSYVDTQVNTLKTGVIKTAQDTADSAVAAAGVADGKAVQAQNEVDALETLVGTLPTDGGYTSVVDMITKKTANIASDDTVGAIGDRVTEVEKDVTALEGLVGDTKVETQISNAITALDLANTYEVKGAAADVQEALEGKIGTVTEGKTVVQMIADAQAAATYDDTQVKADIQANEDAIALLNNNAQTEGSVDYKIAQAVAAIMENPDDTMNSIQELVEWTQAHATEALALTNGLEAAQGDIQDLQGLVGTEDVATQIANAITEALKVDGVDKYALAADLTNAITRIAANETAIAQKVDQTAYNTKVGELEAADAEMAGKIAALEGRFTGEDSVEDMISDAQAAAEATAAADATEKANKALEDAKTYTNEQIVTVNTDIDALEEKAHVHSNKALLDTYTQTEANLADAVAKKHEHANASVLDNINSEKVTLWDTVSNKANQTALQSEIDRATAKETELANAIAEFVEISEEEINQLFGA